MQAVLDHCQDTRWRLRNRQRCIEARQRVIDRCFPGDRGDDAHQCAVCQQRAGVERCQEVLRNTFCTEIENAFR